MSDSMKANIPAPSYTCRFETLRSSIKENLFSILFSCFCFQSPYTQVSPNKARSLNISTTQSLIISQRCYAKLKLFNVTITARLQSPASQTAFIISEKAASASPALPSSSAGSVMGDVFWHICLPFKQDLN